MTVARQLARPDADVERRPRDDPSVEDVLDAPDAPTIFGGAPRLLREDSLVLAEDLDVDRLRHAARQVADVVLEELAEIGAERRLGRRDPRSQLVDDVVDRPAAPRGFSLMT